MDFLYCPIDEITGSSPNYDCAADYLELGAFFASDSRVLTAGVTSSASMSAESDEEVNNDLDAELSNSEDNLVASTVERIRERRKVLNEAKVAAYPFELDTGGNTLTCTLDPESLGHAAYMLSLVLSNLRALSPILKNPSLHPKETEVVKLRAFFQYFATAALASEIQGCAWSFGFPRPDSSGFIPKLEEICQSLEDGVVEPQPGAPTKPKDDKVDVFAARCHPDGLPGFLLAVAQVATGKDARNKSITGHLDKFKSRWFRTQPVTRFIPYMIMPFTADKDQFRDDVRDGQNVLHRLRVPRRVVEAEHLVQAGERIEGYDRLAEAAEWINGYRQRARQRP